MWSSFVLFNKKSLVCLLNWCSRMRMGQVRPFPKITLYSLAKLLFYFAFSSFCALFYSFDFETAPQPNDVGRHPAQTDARCSGRINPRQTFFLLSCSTCLLCDFPGDLHFTCLHSYVVAPVRLLYFCLRNGT